MCGLAGFIGFSNGEELAHQANLTQRHRGPDDQSIWSDGFVAFAHQRLSIIDLSERSNQPLIKGNLLIIFNGEIYNYKSIRKELIDKYNVHFLTTSDTEVLLEAYRHYQERCLDFLEGMYAFAIYNIETQETFIARDHFGIKPLFYTVIDGNVAFASEMKTLLGVPGFKKTINYKSLVSSVNYLWVSGNDTMFDQCYKLPPGCYLTLNKKKEYRIVRYYELPERASNQNEASTTNAVDQLFNHSVEMHMVSDVPVSTFLSGGLDSSLISVLAKQHTPTRLVTYTISTSVADKKAERMPDDEVYAKKIASINNFDYCELQVNPDVIDLLPRMVYHLDEPIGDPAAINTFLICEKARANGSKVLLSGMGADELFGGYRRQYATLLTARFQSLPISIRKLITGLVDYLPVKVGKRGLVPIRWGKRFLSFASLPKGEAYMRSYSYYDREELKKLFVIPVSDEVNQLYSDHETLFNEKFTEDIVNQMCYTDLHMFMVGLNLTYTDRASMASSVEVRVPFIDKKVIEYAFQVPGFLKIKRGQAKYILKRMAEKYLPKEIIYRPKASFGAPIRSWISNELRPMIDDYLSQSVIEKRGIFNYATVKEMIDQDRSGTKDYAYQLYQLLTLEIWFRTFVD